jgi:hypothetical protein
MTDYDDTFAGLLAAARRIAATGPIPPAARGAYLGAVAALGTTRGAPLTAALARLDAELAAPALAAMLRATVDEDIQRMAPDHGAPRQGRRLR